LRRNGSFPARARSRRSADRRGQGQPARPPRARPPRPRPGKGTRFPSKKTPPPPLQPTKSADLIAIRGVTNVIRSRGRLGLVEIAWRSFLNPAIVAVLLTAGGWYYHSVRSERRLGAILVSTAQIICFAAVGAPSSYIAAMSGFPLQDAMFDAWDRQLN